VCMTCNCHTVPTNMAELRVENSAQKLLFVSLLVDIVLQDDFKGANLTALQSVPALFALAAWIVSG
jgi:hypothetical protein